MKLADVYIKLLKDYYLERLNDIQKELIEIDWVLSQIKEIELKCQPTD